MAECPVLSGSGQQTADEAVPPYSCPNERVVDVFSRVSSLMSAFTTVTDASIHFPTLNYHQGQVLHPASKALTTFYCVQLTELHFSETLFYHNLCISLSILNKQLAANSVLQFHPALVCVFVFNMSV